MLTRVSTIVSRQALFKANVISQEAATYRYIHLVRQVRQTPRSSLLNLHRNCRVVGIPLIRYASTDEAAQSIPPKTESLQTESLQTESLQSAAPQSNPFDEIPDPPLLPVVEEIIKLHSNGEVTFESIGLGTSYTPVSFIQNFLEYVHINFDLPWWATIATGVLCVRILIFPVVIIAQKNMINFTNHMPTIQRLQEKMSEARHSGDYMESAESASRLMEYMKKNKVNPMKQLILPLAQGPLFISFFLALRKMANVPVESLKDGGFWWIMDLTAPDPYYILPLVTSLTMYITIELGAEGVNLKTMGVMRYIVRAAPFALLPLMINFPGAILTYWVSTNFISLAQTGMLKIPYVRKKFNMPTINISANTAIKKKHKGFVAEFKDAYTNVKITKQLDSRERIDVVQFNSAGKGPLVKTFKYDPTKQKESNIHAKKR